MQEQIYSQQPATLLANQNSAIMNSERPVAPKMSYSTTRVNQDAPQDPVASGTSLRQDEVRNVGGLQARRVPPRQPPANQASFSPPPAAASQQESGPKLPAPSPNLFIVRPVEIRHTATGSIIKPAPMVPLIPVDELPGWLNIEGVPRELTGEQAAGMLRVGDTTFAAGEGTYRVSLRHDSPVVQQALRAAGYQRGAGRAKRSQQQRPSPEPDHNGGFYNPMNPGRRRGRRAGRGVNTQVEGNRDTQQTAAPQITSGPVANTSLLATGRQEQASQVTTSVAKTQTAPAASSSPAGVTNTSTAYEQLLQPAPVPSSVVKPTTPRLAGTPQGPPSRHSSTSGPVSSCSTSTDNKTATTATTKSSTASQARGSVSIPKPKNKKASSSSSVRESPKAAALPRLVDGIDTTIYCLAWVRGRNCRRGRKCKYVHAVPPRIVLDDDEVVVLPSAKPEQLQQQQQRRQQAESTMTAETQNLIKTPAVRTQTQPHSQHQRLQTQVRQQQPPPQRSPSISVNDDDNSVGSSNKPQQGPAVCSTINPGGRGDATAEEDCGTGSSSNVGRPHNTGRGEETMMIDLLA